MSATVRTRLVQRVAATLAMRPKVMVALLVTMFTMATWSSPTPAAAYDEECGGGFSGFVCDGVGAIPGGKFIRDVTKAGIETQKTIEALNPDNILDTWAQGLTSAITYLLTLIQSLAERFTKPAYDQDWWVQQYAVSFGLALLVLPFLLVVIGAKIGGREGSVSGIELLRSSGVRLVFVVPLIAIAPALLYSVQQIAMQLTKTFSTQATVEGHGAVGDILKLLREKAGEWGYFGGAVIVIGMCLLIFIGAIVLLFELAVSQWGLILASLLVPLVLVSWVYPPWSNTLRRLASLIFGLMFLPVMIMFFFWTIWSAGSDILYDAKGDNSGFSMLLFLLVSLIMIDAFPLIGWWLLKLITPTGDDLEMEVRGLAPSPTMGDLVPDRREKEIQQSRGGYSEGSDDGADYDDPDDPDDPDRDSDGGGPGSGTPTSRTDRDTDGKGGHEHDDGGDTGHGSTADTSLDKGESAGTGVEGAEGAEGSGAEGGGAAAGAVFIAKEAENRKQQAHDESHEPGERIIDSEERS